MSAVNKFEKLKERLTQKVRMSATPVKGFILGMSGTDSIVTYILLAEVAKTEGFHVLGCHYGQNIGQKTLYHRTGQCWLNERYPDDYTISWTVNIPTPFEHQFLIADLHRRAISNPQERLWVASTVNATEKALSTYSILEKSASIAPITSLYKSEVLEICEHFGVPQELIDASKTPDCLCGRDEFAAENIQLIDDVLRRKLTRDYSSEDIKKAYDYINMKIADNDFKNRTPYTI